MLLTLYDQTGSVKATLSPNDTSTQDKEIQGDNVLSLSFTLYEYVGIDVNDYVDFEGERYWAVEKYLPNEKSTVEWEYNVKLYGIESLIKRFLVLKTVDGENEAVFTLTARPIDHMRLIVQSINSGMNTSDWKVGTVEGTDNVVIDYFGKYCDEGLKELAEKVGAEWWIEGETVNLCRCEHGEELTLAYGAGLTSLDRDVADNAKFYTRLFPIGSSRNIDPERYGASRLQLPGGVKYVDVNAERYGVIHHYEQEAFSGIYPRRVGVVSSVRSENVQDSDGNPFTIYYFKDDNLTFDPNDYEIGGLVKHVSFQEGSELAGLGADEDHYFEVNYNSETREFEIITIWPYDDDTQLPGGTLVPKVGDRYILWNIRMPDEYYGLAEQEFESAVNEYNSKHALDVSCYKAPTDHVWIEDEDVELYIGRRIRLVSQEYFPDTGYRASRITKIIRHVTLPSQMDLEISDALSTRSLEKIDDAINGVRNYTRTQVNSINLPDVIKSWEGTEPTDNNLYSARASHRHFLNKRIADKALEVITFVKGVLFGDGSHGITEDGDASLRDIRMQSTQSEGYSGTDIITDKGFKVWEDSEGKSHLITDYFSARVKAFFASLEIRKTEHSAGNRIESPAGNTLALVKKFNAADEEIKDKWHARRYGFGLSWGYKLVHAAGRFFGVWKEDETAEVAYYRCYWTADDKEAKKAVTNNWKVGDQAFCETFNLRTQDKNGNTMRGYASNKRYWRLVVGTGYETIEGTDYAYIDLSNVAGYVTVVDEQGQERVCRYGYESGTVDKPEAGDDVACFGNQITPSTRGSAIQYITYDPNAEHSGDGVPCVKMYSGIDSFESLDSFVIQKHSPTGVFVRADKFKIYSAAGTGMSADDPSSTLVCYRGDYSSTAYYAYGDLVQYHGSTWLCISTSKIRGEAPADGSSYWKIYARRGMGAPQIVLDSTNAIVSANSDGKIASISAATGLPTKIELYVDGNKIPVSAWNTLSSYVKYYDRTCYIDQFLVLGHGIVLTNITKNANDVSLSWQYRAEEVMSVGDFTRVVHPVINATDISVHIVFTYNGETYTADASMPMIVQRAGAAGAPGADGADGADGTNGHDVMAEYSVDGSANSWHPVFQNGDVYVHYSYDGGTTWTQAIRFVGKSVEFERGIMHFASYGTMESLLSMTLIGANYVGYYLCDQASDGITAQATLWYWNGRDTLTPVTIQNEVNYLASDYDNNENGHLWNADSNSTSWTDMGVIQGADGVDGISITLDPSSAIFNQAETSPYGIDTSGFSATVRVWQGTTPLSGSFIPQNGVRGTNCQAHFVGNVVYIDSIGYTLDADNQKHYYSSGEVAVDVRINNQTTTLTLNWAANLLGEWKLKVEGDTMESVSNMDVAYYDENGSLTSERLSTAIKQNSRGVYLSAKKDDVESAGIHLDGQNSSIDLIAGKVNFIDPNGGVNTKISIDTTTGTLHAVDGEFEGKITAKNYLTLYADLGTYCYCKNPIEHPEILTEEKLFIPGFHKTMYDVNGNALNIESYWCFILSQGMVVMLPDALPSGESLVGQRIVLYDPTFGGYSNTTYVIIVAGSIELDEDDEDTYYTTIGDVIRGVGIKINSTSPVPVDRWDPVRKIMFTDGITELQCVPSDSNDFDWCVVNIGTNVYHLYENV